MADYSRTSPLLLCLVLGFSAVCFVFSSSPFCFFVSGRPGVEITNHPMAGVDGTDGNHPRYTTVVNNIAREVGLYEQQSSFFVEAKTAQSIILGNERKRLLLEPFISKNDLFTKTGSGQI